MTPKAKLRTRKKIVSALCILLLATSLYFAHQTRPKGSNYTMPGYLLSFDYPTGFSAIQLTSQRASQWQAQQQLVSMMDLAEARYLFSLPSDTSLTPEGVPLTRYDLHTGQVDRLLLDIQLDLPQKTSHWREGGGIYALDRDHLLLQHHEELLHRVEFFSITLNRVLASYTLVRADFPTLLSIHTPYLAILHFNPVQEQLLVDSYSTLYTLDLPTRQLTQLEGITGIDRIITHNHNGKPRNSHPRSLLGLYSGSEAIKGYMLAETKDAVAIYHLPTLQLIQELPSSLPQGDYYLLDRDLILVRNKRYEASFNPTLPAFVWRVLYDTLPNELFWGKLLTDLSLYRIGSNEVELLWAQADAPYLGSTTMVYYLPQFVAYSELE
jgi:hypothetical protein